MPDTKRMKTSDISDAVVVDAYHDAFLRGVAVLDLLAERTGAPSKVCKSAMKRAFGRGLVTTDKPRVGFDYVTPASNQLAIAFSRGDFAFQIARVPKVPK